MIRLRPGESGAEGARRIARAQIGAALRTLERQPLSDKAVHSARKSLKRARAMLRLLRPSLGDQTYRGENAALRDIARPLSGIRDTRVLLQTLERLTRGNRARRSSVRKLELLLDRKRTAIRSRLRRSGSLAAQRAALREAHHRAGHWPGEPHGWSAAAAGLRRVYGQARRARAAARADPTLASLHEWRKQTKYLWHLLQVLASPGTPLAGQAARAHRLAQVLGKDHDLGMLRQVVTAKLTPATVRDGLLGLIDRRTAQLRVRAFALGRELYADSAKELVARLRARRRAGKR